MGKVAFPLHNVRKDVLNNWHFKQLSEDITVSETPDQYGFYTASLVEIPAPSSTSPVVIRGLSEYRKVPVDIKTGELTLPADSFYVNYNTGEILFHGSKAGNTYTAQYYGKGSLVEADDLNDVNERTESMESVISSVQPTLTTFRTELDASAEVVSTVSATVSLLENNVVTVSADVSEIKSKINQKADSSYVESQLNETRNMLVSYTSAGGEIDQRIASKMGDYVSEESYAADQTEREAAYDEKYAQASVVSTLSSTVAGNTADISSNLTKINTNAQDIQTLQSSVSQLSESKADKTAVDENTAAISNLNTSLAEVTSTAGTNSTNISNLASSLETTNENVATVSSRVEVIENDYVKSASITPLATKEELGGYVPVSTLSTLATKSEISDMATKTDLQGYVQTEVLDTLATKEDLEGYVSNDVLDTLATKEDLEDYVQTEVLDTLATKTELEGYVQTDVLDTLATKTELEGYVQTEVLDTLATKDEISAMATVGDLENYVQTEVLDTLATKEDLESYVQNSTLSNYATVASLDNYVTLDGLEPYATKEEVAENYAAIDTLGNFATSYALEATITETNDQINSVNNRVDSNYFVFLDRITGLEMKINNLSRTNIVNVPSAAQITYTDPTGDVVIEADQTMTQRSEITAKSVEVKSLDINSDISAPAKFIAYTDGQVEISNLEIEGAYKTAASEGSQVSIYSSDYVSIKDCNFNASGRNAIEIGLDVTNSTRVSKSIFIDNCHFNGTLGNNAISVFGQQNDTIVKISNCTFTDVSNVLRISNRTNTKATFIFENCTFSKWESDPQYGGVVICQDYKSGSVEAEESNNLFAPEKIKIQFINCTGPDGNKIVGSDSPADYCASGNENQLIYVYGNAGGIVSYDPARYPEVTFG